MLRFCRIINLNGKINMMHIELNEDVKYIINRLKKAGFEAYAVGGCIRDSIMGLSPGDWDITTNAKPYEIKRYFKRSIDTGIEHGTVTLLINKNAYEVTTYRVDGKYSDGRHPDGVMFCSSLTEDLKRRDFTINAMAYNDDEGLIDSFGGSEDIKKRTVRCVGDPNERFLEDGLRMLRAVRFCAVLDFKMEKNTYEAIKLLHKRLSSVSSERIFIELDKILRSKHPEYIRFIFESGLYKYCFREFDKIDISDIELLVYAGDLPNKRYMRWAAFMRNLDVGTIKAILRGLKADNESINKTSVLAQFIKEDIPDSKSGLKRLLLKIGKELLEAVIIIKSSKLAKYDAKLGYLDAKQLEKIKNNLNEIYKYNEPYSIDMLDIDGSTLINLGIKEGPQIGIILKKLLEQVIERPEINSRDILLGCVKDIMS